MSPLDALDPGPDGSYRNVPRLPDGTVDRVRFPHGVMKQDGVVIDVTVRDQDGREIAPDEEG